MGTSDEVQSVYINHSLRLAYQAGKILGEVLNEYSVRNTGPCGAGDSPAT
jgi:hypothetical protein